MKFGSILRETSIDFHSYIEYLKTSMLKGNKTIENTTKANISGARSTRCQWLNIIFCSEVRVFGSTDKENKYK